MNERWTVSVVIKCVFAVLLLIGCSRTKSQKSGEETLDSPGFHAQVSDAYKPQRINTIVVSPVIKSDQLEIEPHRLEDLTRQLSTVLALNTSMVLLNLDQAETVASGLRKIRSENPDLGDREVALKLGKLIGAQGVVCTQVGAFNEKITAGVQEGADSHVGFNMELVNVETGQMLWRGLYSKKNEPLTENLFKMSEKFSEGVGYKTSSELIEQGFVYAASSLEKIRQSPLTNK